MRLFRDHPSLCANKSEIAQRKRLRWDLRSWQMRCNWYAKKSCFDFVIWCTYFFNSLFFTLIPLTSNILLVNGTWLHSIIRHPLTYYCWLDWQSLAWHKHQRILMPPSENILAHGQNASTADKHIPSSLFNTQTSGPEGEKWGMFWLRGWAHYYLHPFNIHTGEQCASYWGHGSVLSVHH